MKLFDLRTLAEWHAQQEKIHLRDYMRDTSTTNADAGRRSYDLYVFHKDAAANLRALADAFTTFAQLSNEN